MAIITDETRIVPIAWTHEECQELFEHAKDLEQKGNPSARSLVRSLHQYVGSYDNNGAYIKDEAEWDYDGIRAWIAGHTERVKRIWQSKFTGWKS
jgi:hypothetical protein